MLSMLGHHAFCVDHACVYLIAKSFGECVVDDLERAALVVPEQVLHVLQYKGGRLVVLKNGGNGEKEVALPFILKAVLPPETIFLRDACEAERLTGKPAQRMSNGGMSATGMEVMSPWGFSPKLAA